MRPPEASSWFVAIGDPTITERDRIVTATDVTLLLDGLDYVRTWKRQLETLMRGDRVLHTAFAIDDIPIGPGESLYEAIRAAARRGVDVFVRVSGHSVRNRRFSRVLSTVDGVQIAVDRSLPWIPSIGSNHEKSTVFIGGVTATAMVGSMDLTHARLHTSLHIPDKRTKTSHEAGVLVRGDVAWKLAEDFASRWNAIADRSGNQEPLLHWSPARERTGIPIQVLRTVAAQADHPRFAAIPADYSIVTSLENAIERASRLIYIEDQFFWPVTPLGDGRGPRIVDALRKALQRGTHVVMITNTPTIRVGHVATVLSRHPALLELQVGASESHGRLVIGTRWSGNRPVQIHAKVLVVDDQFTLIGSANLNDRSWSFDYELDLGIFSHKVSRFTRAALTAEHLGVDVGLAASWSPDEWLAAWVSACREGIRVRRYEFQLAPSSLATRIFVRRSWWRTVSPTGGPAERL